MAEPTKKSEAVEKKIKETWGVDRVQSIRNDECAWCSKPASSFRDQASEKEYTISGLCQWCQDQVFGPG